MYRMKEREGGERGKGKGQRDRERLFRGVFDCPGTRPNPMLQKGACGWAKAPDSLVSCLHQAVSSYMVSPPPRAPPPSPAGPCCMRILTGFRTWAGLCLRVWMCLQHLHSLALGTPLLSAPSPQHATTTFTWERYIHFLNCRSHLGVGQYKELLCSMQVNMIYLVRSVALSFAKTMRERV